MDLKLFGAESGLQFRRNSHCPNKTIRLSLRITLHVQGERPFGSLARSMLTEKEILIQTVFAAVAVRQEAERERERLLQEAEAVRHEVGLANRARIESEERFRIVAENARAVFGIVQGRRFVYANPYLSELSGYTNEEILTMDITELIHPNSRAKVLQYATQRQRGISVPQHYEFAMVTKSGETRWLDFSPALISLNGEPSIVGTAFDITDRKRAQELLIQSEILASVGRMAATVSHEINNPLAAAMNCIYLAQHSCDQVVVRGFLDTADEELRRIAHLTKLALGFYRESSSPTSVSTVEVMESALGLLKSKIKAKHVQISKEYGDDAVVTAIAGELRQVLANLLANSLEAVNEKGVIRVRISTHNAQTGHGVPFVSITVADDGSGISDAVRPRIFDPLFTTRIGVGTGLGLWVSREIVEKHHGHIRVHSRTLGARRGTTFSVVLPAGPAGVECFQVVGHRHRPSVPPNRIG